MDSSSDECPDEVPKLEAKVVSALARLQNDSTPCGSIRGVRSKQVVEYLCSHYCHLDGDVESQVMTALLSCVKNGIICALNNGKYRLISPISTSMLSNCIRRTVHGPNCCCLNKISNLSKNFPKVCCIVQSKKPFKSINRILKGNSNNSVKCKPIIKSKKKKSGKLCVQDMHKALEQEVAKGVTGKCNYCLQHHPPPDAKPKKPKKRPCGKCFPSGTSCRTSYDEFSPRDKLRAKKC